MGGIDKYNEYGVQGTGSWDLGVSQSLFSLNLCQRPPLFTYCCQIIHLFTKCTIFFFVDSLVYIIDYFRVAYLTY